jgi:hypothetical protein
MWKKWKKWKEVNKTKKNGKRCELKWKYERQINKERRGQRMWEEKKKKTWFKFSQSMKENENSKKEWWIFELWFELKMFTLTTQRF